MHDHPEITLFVNDEKIVVHAESLFVKEILDNGGFDSAEDVLVELRDGQEIELRDLDERVKLHDGMRFRVVQKRYHIVVNGRPKTVETDMLSFDRVVELAPNLPPPAPGVEYKVAFRDAVLPKDGTLIPGESVKIKNGTEFVVTATNRS